MNRAIPSLPPTIGIDPGVGMSETAGSGIVAVQGQSGAGFLRSTSVQRQALEPFGPYAHRVWEGARMLMALGDPSWEWLVAIEMDVDPSGWIGGKRAARPKGMQQPERAALTGALWAWGQPRSVLVRPGGHGSMHKARGMRPEVAYPSALCGRRPPSWPAAECRDRSHERSAFDVAVTGALQWRAES